MPLDLDLTVQFLADYEQLEREIERLRAVPAGMDEEEAENLRNQNRELQRQAARLQEERKKARSEAEASRRKLHESESRIHELESENARLIAQLETAQAAVANLKRHTEEQDKDAPRKARPAESAELDAPLDAPDSSMVRCPHCKKFMLLDDPEAGADTPCLFCGASIPLKR
jgi:septal ring factor EnvC (AmiA/AmiB activator)